MYWYDATRVGLYLPASGVPTGKPGGPVYTCPNDDAGAHLSYAYNIWASCAVDAGVTKSAAQSPPQGLVWGEIQAAARPSSKLMLLVEVYSSTGSATVGWYAKPTVGLPNVSTSTPPTTPTTPGERFGGGTGVVPPLNMARFGIVISELCYMRHRPPNSRGTYTQPRGVLNIAYADGHVEPKTDRDLVTADGKSTGDSLWTPIDAVGQ